MPTGPARVPRPGFRQAVQGFLDPSAVQPGETENYLGQISRAKEAMQQGGLQTQVPQMEAPTTPSVGTLAETQGRQNLAGLVRGFTGTVPITPYGVKLGHRAGM